VLDFIITFLCSPGFVTGALVGIGFAFGLHWLWPGTPPMLGGLVIAFCCILGFAFEGSGKKS